jgi:hypothetical protein
MNAISKWLWVLAMLAGSAAANAALLPADGGLLVDDSDANLTWVADANLMATQAAASGNLLAFVQTIINDSGGVIHDTPNAYDTPADSGAYNLSAGDFNTTTGAMSWYGAQAWVHHLNVTKYRGYGDWRLPTTADNSGSFGSPPSPSTSEMANLFYGQLGQASGQSITTTHNGNYPLFSNIQGQYWSGTEDAQAPNVAWFFAPFFGGQGNITKDVQYGALAVRTGLAFTPPSALLAALLQEVRGVAPEALTDRIEQAQRDLRETCEDVARFAHEVHAHAGKKISPQLDAKLIADAQAIEAAMGCGSLSPE